MPLPAAYVKGNLICCSVVAVVFLTIGVSFFISGITLVSTYRDPSLYVGGAALISFGVLITLVGVVTSIYAWCFKTASASQDSRIVTTNIPSSGPKPYPTQPGVSEVNTSQPVYPTDPPNYNQAIGLLEPKPDYPALVTVDIDTMPEKH